MGFTNLKYGPSQTLFALWPWAFIQYNIQTPGKKKKKKTAHSSSSP
jgi:hypothetical protein